MKLLCCTVVLACTYSVLADEPRRIEFNRDIRPILSDNCFQCHGPDQQKRQAGLRLDERESATAPAESGQRAIVPGHPEQSELVNRIQSADEDLVMPPPSSGKTLTPAEKDMLRQWIAAGAAVQQHWAFVPPGRPPVPDVGDSRWPRNEIDAFILQALTTQGWQPSPEASREDLLRRLSLDLTGLPPTLEELDRFLADDRADAFDREVDRLLASPHYGERMAVDWLDAARFADTNGYHLDNGRDMSAWRAWVIDAFNSNMPFDQFTIEQMAGDLLPNPTIQQQIASGFHRNHMINFEGGAIPDEYLTAYIVDRVNTTGAVWLGLTVGCAQCHDHKYDPLTQREFYQLYAFFNNVPENGLDGNKGNAMPLVSIPTRDQEQQLASLDQQAAEVGRKLMSEWPAVDAEQAAWEDSVRAGQEPSVTLSGGLAAEKTDPGLVVSDWSAVGPLVHREGPNRAFNVNLGPERRPVDLSAKYTLHDEDHGWAAHPEWLDGQTIRLPGERAATYLFRSITATEAGQATLSLGTTDAVRVWWNQKDILRSDTQRDVAADQHTLTVDLKPGKNELLIKVVGMRAGASFICTMSSEAVQSIPVAVRQIVQTPAAQRSPESRQALATWYRRTVSRNADLLKLTAQLTELEKQRSDLKSKVRTSMVMAEMESPRETYLLVRGQYDRRGDKVQTGTPAFLPSLPADRPPNRLDLGRWLVDERHPLVSRVIVNRLWQSLFGLGLVKTTEDFGSQGERPSHPELLDWLAVEFMNSSDPAVGRWDVKALVKKMMTSAAYRQTSRVGPEIYSRDPENRFLGRGSRFRLQAEFVRDQALAVSGLIRHDIGGASVSPYQPDGLWTELSSRGDSRNWTAQFYEQSHGDDLYRRTMYTFWKRTSPPPTLVTFDAPDREICTVRRSRTNTPLQALVLMNDPTYVEASRALAERLLKSGNDDEHRLRELFRLLTARQPNERELASLQRLLQQQTEYFRTNPEAAAAVLAVGESKRDTTIDALRHAAWAMVASAVTNLDEAVTRN